MDRQETFDPSFFERLRSTEETHFWFRARRKWIFDALTKFLPPPATLLEVGCGTGNVSSFLSKKGYAVTGCEYYEDAIRRAWPGFRIVQGDANNLPFEDGSFDIVGLFDVIEHFQDDLRPMREAARVCRKGGIVAITVPMGEELWSWYDETARHKRRYSVAKVQGIFSEAKLTPLSMKHMFLSLLLPMSYIRSRGKTDDIFRVNPLVNAVFAGLSDIERYASRLFPLPAGTSLIAVARKDP
jgi:SAM-dependent methyltransferase